MSLASFFGWTALENSSNEIPDIFPFSIVERDFVSTDIVNIFAKILTDVLERTQGLPEKHLPLLWDNCLASESQDGLVSMLSKAMAEKKELFLVFDPAVNLIRKAKPTEETLIKADYLAKGQSVVGVYVTFKNYSRTDMLKIYSVLEYCTIASLSKSMRLSKAIQLKFNELRSSVGLTDSEVAKGQGRSIATSLANGNDVMLDAKDIIETAKPDLTATQSAMEFINEKRSFYLGLPASYITGRAPKGMGDSGEGDAKAIERGLKNYFFSIIKPTVEAIFGVKLTFKSEDFRQISSSLEALKTFELTSDELISKENKNLIVNKLFGLPEDAKGDAPEKGLTPPGMGGPSPEGLDPKDPKASQKPKGE